MKNGCSPILSALLGVGDEKPRWMTGSQMRSLTPDANGVAAAHGIDWFLARHCDWPPSVAGPARGFEVQDGLALLQLIRRLVKAGGIEDIELAALAMLRARLVKQIEEVTGVNHDSAVVQAMQRRTRAQAAAPVTSNGAAQQPLAS
jgi:hypothetical protein